MYEHSDKFINNLESHIRKAIDKHPAFCGAHHEAICILVEEIGEVAQAINDKDNKKAMAELLDAVAVAYRLYHRLDREQLDKEYEDANPKQ